MAREMIDEIRRAETQAEAVQAGAQERAQEILRKAQEDAAAIIQEMTKKAREDADRARENAKEECCRMLEAAGMEERAEAGRLEAAASDRRGQVVDAVLSALM